MTGRHTDCAGALPACAHCAWRAAQAEFILLWDTSHSRHRPERMRQLLAAMEQLEDAIRAPATAIGSTTHTGRRRINNHRNNHRGQV